MPKYISHNRIRATVNSSTVSAAPVKIEQPPAPSTTVKQFFQSSPKTEYTAPKAVLSSKISAKVSWLKNHSYKPLPESMTRPSNVIVSDIAIVVAYTGANDARYAANEKAMTRLLHASPRPAQFIFVELVNPGEIPHYTDLESKGWDKVITLYVTEKSECIFQKEAMWSIGARYAFSIEGVTKCIFMDADSAFDDNSWAVYCSEALRDGSFGQPFSCMYYSDQPDMINCYGTYGVLLSMSYDMNNSNGNNVPGGAFMCTKEFFNTVLPGHWPYDSLGSGDSMFWGYLKGKATIRRPYCFADITGYFPNLTPCSADLMLIHYYHGPMSDRMYITRDYISKRTTVRPGSDIHENKDGVLEWNDSITSKLALASYKLLKEKTAECVAQRKALSINEYRPYFKELAEGMYGSISSVSPLHVITYMTDDVSPETIEQIHQGFINYCKTPFIFIVHTTKPEAVISADKIITIPLDKRYVSKEWLQMSMFKYDGATPATNCLIVSPNVSINKPFTMARCPENTFYMSKSISNGGNRDRYWTTDIMFFRYDSSIYDTFVSELDTYIELMFEHPSDYLISLLRSKKTIEDVLHQVDYCFDGSRSDLKTISDIVIH